MTTINNLPPRPLALAGSRGSVSPGLLAAVFFILFVAACGWGYYDYDWVYRLPQDRSLTLQGKTLQVRVESANNAVVKYTLLADSTTGYAAVSSLDDANQDFVQHLSKTLVLNYPLEMPLDQGDGHPVPSRIEGHNADWVKYTVLADRSTHYIPLATLTTSDQVVVQQLPNYILVDTPLVHPMTGPDGQFLPSRIEGTSDNLVKLSTTDGSVTYFPINALSAIDQKLVRLVSSRFSLYCPVECTLTNRKGQKLNVRVEGRSANIIKYTQVSDGLVYYVPTAEFSSTDQQVLRELPSNMVFTFPIDYTLTDATGNPMRVRLDGRTANLVEFTSTVDGLQHYLPMSAFSDNDQKFLQLLPADLVIQFPLNYTLTAQGGQPLEARILGRDADSVKFQLEDGKTYNYRLDKLSDASQTFLKLLPANLVDASSTPESVAAAPIRTEVDVAPDLAQQRDRLAGLVRYFQKIQDALDQPHGANDRGGVITQGISIRSGTLSTGGGATAVTTVQYLMDGRTYDRRSLLGLISANADDIEATCKQINDDLAQVPPSPNRSTNVISWWQQAMELIKRGNQIRRDISSAGSSEAQALENDLLSNQKDLVILLNRINAESGQYSP